MGVEIRTKGLDKPEKDFDIALVDLEDLIPHEQIIDKELKWFIKGLKDEGKVIWPLLISDGSCLILDGHHRTAGLKKLNYTNAPAITIDYYDDDLISLDTWYPKVNKKISILLDVLESLDISIVKVNRDSLNIEQLRNREFTAYVGNQRHLYKITGEREAIFKELRDRWVNDIIYYDDPMVCIEKTDQDSTAVLSWSYTKSEILDHVENGILHLPKTTRHELKYKVPKCNYPIEELNRTNN